MGIYESGYPDIRRAGVDGRPGSGFIPESVHYTVLDTQCGEIQAFQWRFDCRYVDTEGIFNAEPLFPWLFYRQVIDVVFVAVTGLGDSLQNTGGDAGMQVDQPAILKGTGAVDAAGNSLMNVKCIAFSGDFFQLVRQCGLQSSWTGAEIGIIY